MPVRRIKIAINGLGRIGREIARRIITLDTNTRGLELIAINTIDPLEASAFLLERDTLYGKFPIQAIPMDGELILNGRKIRMFHIEDPALLPWKDLDIDLVIECAGIGQKAWGHLEAGAARVIVAGSIPNPDITVSMGVNHQEINPDMHRMICGASCTTAMIAPALKVLDNKFGVEKAMVTFVHSYTNDQALLDSCRADLRRARSATQNLIPTTTSAIRHLSEIFPHLQGKIDGTAIRVPTPIVHMAHLIVQLHEKIEKNDLLDAMMEASKGPMKDILAINHDPLVSTDFKGESHSCIVDMGLSTTFKDMARILIWHDNEYGYCSRLLELIEYVASLTVRGSKAGNGDTLDSP